MPQTHPRPTICIDLGKTRCRVALMDDSGTLASTEGPGVAGAAARGGSASIAHQLLMQVKVLQGSSDAAAVGAGIAGTLTNPAAGADIAKLLALGLRIPVAITSDIVAAHIGALSGGAGVALVAGTGAVALGLSTAGELRRIDGWGPELGDLGGGSWIGREGIRAALLANAGITGKTTLQLALARMIAPDLDAARWLASANDDENVGGRLASFAPNVLTAAADADATASGIIAAALGHLGATAAAAGPTSRSASDQVLVSVLGGLNDSPYFAAALDAELRARGLTPVAPVGTALDGARAVANTHTFPHERYIHRAQ